MKKLLLFLFFTVAVGTLMAQTTVSGKVVSAEGDPLIGVNILEVGSTNGTVSDLDGTYSITVADPNGALEFSYTGYSAQTVALAGRSTVDLTLQEGVTLEEAVVTALGIERDKKALNYSVTEVEGEGFQEARELNIANAIAGKVAGVNVSSIASGPAGSSRVIIRGNTSLGGNNQPLYVIDGVPLDNSGFGQSGLWGGSDEGDGTSSINPDDIETMTVLKGANAGALYGSRASNGVILITTKSGKNRKGIGIEINSNLVAETFVNHFEVQEIYGHGDRNEAPEDAGDAWSNGNGSQWGGRLDGRPVPNFDGVNRPYTFNLYDNLDKYYETGTTFTNTIGFTGGDENHRVRLNLSDLRSKSMIPNAGFDRQNASLSYNGKMGDRVTVTSKILYSHEVAENRPRIADSPGNGFQGLVTLPVNYEIDALKGDPDKLGAVSADFIPPDGKAPGEELQISTNLWNQNPWWAAYQFSNDDVRDRVITSNVIKLDVTDFLYVQGRHSMDWYTRRDSDRTPYGTGYARGGNIQERERRIREVNLEGLLGLDQDFGSLNINAVVGGNRMRASSETLSLTGSNYNIPFFDQISNLSNQSLGYGLSEKGINSVFGSITFGYDNFLYLTATARNDWFSTLNPETNDILYSSIGGSFIFTEFMENNSWLTFGKLRASWAQVGGDTDPYRLNLSYSLGQGHNGLPNGNIAQSSIPNALLKPLTSTEIEVGLDLRMFNNRVGVDFTWYTQTTTDDILNASIAESSGFSATTINIGEITNTGVELLITARPFQSANFAWDVSFNFGYNDSEVVTLSDGLDQIRVDGNLGQPRTRWAFIDHIVGERFGSITGFTQEMINGQPVFDPNTGQPVRSSSTALLGNGVNRFTGGINNSLTYKGLYFDFLIDFKAGGQIYSGTNVRLMSQGLHAQTTEQWSALGVEVNGRESFTVNGVDQEGNPLNRTYSVNDINEDGDQTSNVVRGFYGAYSSLSDRFIRNSAFGKLRQVSLGYNLPSSILSNTPIINARVSFVGRNLLVLWDNIENVDPESTYNNSNAQGLDYFGIPPARSYGVNLKLGF